MRYAIMLLAAAPLVASCKKTEKPDPKPAPPSGVPGIAMGSGAGAGATAMKPASPDDLVKHFHDCWGAWSAGKWDDFKACYESDAVAEAPGSGMPDLKGNMAITDAMKAYRAAFPDEKAASQLVLVDGKKVIGVSLLTGKQTAALKLPGGALAATNKSIGFYLGQVLAFDDAGKVTHEQDFYDVDTLLGQLKPMADHPVRPAIDKLPMTEDVEVAKDDAREKANLATFQQLTDKLSKHDTKGVGELLADDVVWSEQPMAKDETKKDVLATLPALWKGFSDLKFKVDNAWAAGDYVAATETFEGTNDGDLPMMHVKKTGKKLSLPVLAVHKIDGGKIKAVWIFFQGGGFASQLGLPAIPAGELATK